MAALARALAFALIASGGALVQERLAAAAGVKWCSPRLDRAHYANFTEQLRLFVTQPRDALSAPDAVADAVRRVGLTPTALEIKLDENGTRGSIYGEESVWRLPVPGYAMSEGIWQIPQQLECAFSFLRTLHIQHWLTVGTWSGWTDAFTNAYMRRFAPSPEAFTHVTFDIEGHLTPCVSTQLNALRVTRVLLGDPVVINSAKKVKSKRREKDGTVRLLRACTPATPNRTGCSLGEYLRATTADGAPALGALPVYDLCFIDGDHTYRAVRRDFVTLLARCRAVMFHDVVNKRVGMRNVPRFWGEIKAGAFRVPGVYDYETRECLYQPRLSDQRMMGIAIMRVRTPIPLPEQLLPRVLEASRNFGRNASAQQLSGVP